MSVPAPSLRSDEQPLAQYRAISSAALLALGLGIASPLVLVSPILAIVAMAAIGASIAALRSIHASEGQLVGKVPAILGLSLATLFLGWGLSRQWSRQTVIEQNARQLADAWLALIVNGELHQAHQLQSPAEQRMSSPEAMLNAYDRDLEAQESFRKFIKESPLADFIRAGKNARYELQSVEQVASQGTIDRVLLAYQLDLPPDHGGPRVVWITVEREIGASSKVGEWEIVSVLAERP